MATFTNLTGDMVQHYGINPAQQAAEDQFTFGTQAVEIFDNTGEGVWAGIQPDGTVGWYTSRTTSKTIDLLCEGEIEGIVSGEWIPSGIQHIGQLGYTDARFEPYQDGTMPEAYLRSVFLNDTPVVSEGGYYNFQNLEFAFTDGTPDGIRDGDDFLNIGETSRVEKTRIISERLYGPDDDNAENPLVYNSKTYRVLNREVDKVLVNIKIPALTWTKRTEDVLGEGTPLADATEEQMEQIGKIVGSKITFRVRYRPIYANPLGGTDLNLGRKWYPDDRRIEEEVKGIVRQPYLHQMEIDFSADTDYDELNKDELIGWEIEITRITLESITSNVANQSYVDSLTEVFSNSLSHPNSALISMNFNAEYFSQVPNRAFDVRLLKVKVPSGYDPIRKHYPVAENTQTPNWDGTFADEKQWTDNPAWVFYDLLTNRRYGLGKYVNNLTIDKWTLWEISKYCDTLVPNDDGELEPRFACNVLINTREEAYQVLKDFASIFRGMIYYGLGNIHAVQDRPKIPVALFNNSNVENGNFTYASSSKKTRNTVIIIRYNDRNNQYKPAVEYVEDTDAIRKYGVIEKEVTAFGCTSRTQARRLGKWLLVTELYENEMCNFVTGPEAMVLRPGDVIKVADSSRYKSSQGGRTLIASPTGVILDRVLDIDNTSSYLLSITSPTYYYDGSLVDTEDRATFREDTVNIADFRRSQIQSTGVVPSDSNYVIENVAIATGSNGVIEGTAIRYKGAGVNMFNPASGQLTGEMTWNFLETGKYLESFFSVISIKESAELKYSIEALQHRPEKYLSIESGIPLDSAPSYGGTTIAPTNPAGVTAVEEPLPNTSHTKQIKITIQRPSTVGNEVGYRIYVKQVPQGQYGSGSTFDPVDIDYGNRPKSEFLWQTTYLSEHNGDPVVIYIPERNLRGYVVRVFSVNGVSMLSSGFEEDRVLVTQHFPVRDITLHSLRLVGQAIFEDPSDPNWTPAKAHFGHLTTKDALVTFDVEYPHPQFSNIAFSFRAAIHYPVNDISLIPNAAQGYFDFEGNLFDFTFAKNMIVTNGPYRNYDLTVVAVDLDSNTSDYSAAGNYTTNGWDIIEVDNPRPEGFFLTPRNEDRGRPGYQCSTSRCGAVDKIITDQYIDAMGNVVIEVMASAFQDLAGGFIYLSAHPFSGGADGDFLADGSPDNYTRTYSKLTDEEFYDRSGQFQIIKIPFDVEKPGCCPKVMAHPDSVGHTPFDFDISDTFYMSAKFYDSFDKALKDYYEADPTQRQQHADWDDNMWMGFVRHNTGVNGLIQTKQYKMYENPYTSAPGDCCFTGEFLADTTDIQDPNGVGFLSLPQPTGYYGSGIFSCPIRQKMYTSANLQGGFKYWIRMNVNGQWEGNGISHVRTLTQKDVDTYYGYDGFYEYGCTLSESRDVNGFILPNDNQNITRCRFRQGQLLMGNDNTFGTSDDRVGDVGGQITYWPSNPQPDGRYVTGAVHVPDGSPLYYGGTLNVGQKAGVHQSNVPSDDSITSYNHRGDAIAYRDRPLYGYRRYRVYFDPYNLPEPFKPNGLASYSVLGINCWNGPYEAWPGSNISVGAELWDSLFFAKDGTGIFPETVRSWMPAGALFENIPGVWNHHPAGFGQGFGGLIKERTYFDIHLGRMIDDSYLNEGFFGVVASNDYSIIDQSAYFLGGSVPDIHASTYANTHYTYDADGLPYQDIE